MRLSHQTEGIMPVRATLHAQVNRASFMGTSRKSWLRLYILAFLERTEDEFSRLRKRKKEKKTCLLFMWPQWVFVTAYLSE